MQPDFTVYEKVWSGRSWSHRWSQTTSLPRAWQQFVLSHFVVVGPGWLITQQRSIKKLASQVADADKSKAATDKFMHLYLVMVGWLPTGCCHTQLTQCDAPAFVSAKRSACAS